MTRLTSLLALSALGAAALGGGALAACTVTTNNNGDDGGTAGDDSSTIGDGSSIEAGTGAETSTEAGPDGSGEASTDAAVEAEAEAAPPPVTYIRLANWAPDAPAAGYDFCIAPHNMTNWTGPIIASQLAAAAGDGGVAEAGLDAGDGGDAGGPTALMFPGVTDYFSVSPATYDVQIVPAGSTSCTGGVTTATTLPLLAANAYTTFAIMGDVTVSGSDHALEIVPFADDSTASSGNALLRVINGAPSITAVDFGEGTIATTFTPLMTNVQFGKAGSTLADGGTLDTNDYLTLAPLSSAKLSAHISGGTVDTATATVTVPAGGIATLALVYGKYGGALPQFILCTDNSGPTTGVLGVCSPVSP